MCVTHFTAVVYCFLLTIKGAGLSGLISALNDKLITHFQTLVVVVL